MKIKVFGLFFALILCAACAKDPQETPQPLPQRTVLVYMAADNNLYKNAARDMDEMCKSSVP
ncbi:MAG: peptidase C11, partial [Prevotellaceae bacterium]|nr:peptidase C11 [Prevotellaceae bacterium]